MNKSLLDSLVLEIYSEKTVQELQYYLPFLSKSVSDKIAILEYEKNKLKNIHCLAHFMEKRL